MRIAICGTHGVGKTTLATALSKRIGVPMIKEVARDIIKMAGFKNTREYIEKATKDQFESIQRDILSRQKMIEIMTSKSSRNGFVSDRSVFDALAYAKAYGVTGYVLHEMTGEAVTHALNAYDLIVYLPPLWAPKEDGFRDSDEFLQMKVDFIVLKYIDAFSLFGGDVLMTKTVTLEERTDEVLNAIEWVKKKRGKIWNDALNAFGEIGKSVTEM